MKNTVLTRIFSILLCCAMLVGILPMTALAAWEDGRECWFCNHYHWDDYCCGTCGACSEECTNGDCYLSTHCSECGACDKEADDCPECLSCEDCYVNNGWHCLGCNECNYVSEDNLCGMCWFCEDCMGGLCDGCGFCESCWEVELMHCDECGNCYGTYEICQYDYLHCEECCIICESCDECLYEDGIELCEHCGLCVFCCQDNANAEGCDCGEYCVESPEWYEHLCSDCGNAFCTIEICELCELCLDCCEGNSECSDTPPVCVEDLYYDEHFCSDCGDCFHVNDACESCNVSGEFLCESCCELRLEAEGCDCDDRCISDGDIEVHITSSHKNAGPHSATPQKNWDMNETHHWTQCRFCSESSHITNKTKHTFDNYGICTVCRYDSQKVILILKQPQSFVVKVSDMHVGGEDDPLHPYNNKHTLTVAAKGTTRLKYQWYKSFDNGEKWIAINDDTDIQSYTYTVGSKTNTLTLTVPVDACAYDHAYKCVITDEHGNQVTTNTVYMKVAHTYRIYSKSQGELIGIINQPNSANNIGMYASEGHYIVCVGDECDASRLVPHSFGKNTRLIFDSKTGVGWHERVCIHCGYKSYLENHVHHFYDPDSYDCNVDLTYKNESQHRLICLFAGCNQTHLEPHDYLGWQNHGTPYTNADGVGIAYKECQICGYSSTKKLKTYSASKDELVDAEWTKSTDLVYVENGYSSCDVVVSGTKTVIGFAPSEYAKQEMINTPNPTVVRWIVDYRCDKGSGAPVTDIDVTEYFTFEKVENEQKWIVTIPLFAGRQGGGLLIFTPVVESCKHNEGTRIKNACEPICTQDGYTGDTVCVGCDGVILYGKVIESAGKHEGKLTLIPGTSKQGTCESRGYEGTYRCDRCNKTVRGKTTSRVHNARTVTKNEVKPTCTKFGYSGDVYCECGVLLEEGEILAPRHSDLKLINADKVSCRKKGYTGDWYCYDCEQTVKYGYNIAKGDHAWSKWGKVDDVYHRHTCVVAGCGAEEKSKHTDADRNLICDGCGYTWKPNEMEIRHIAFNIDVPTIGAKPDYTAFNGPAFASEGNASPSRNGVRWFDVTDNKFLVSGVVGHEFKEGHVYRVSIDFRTKGDYTFASESILAATINGIDAQIEYVNYETFAGISYTFETLKHQHTMTRVDKVSPTCTKPGKQTYYHCSTCDKYFENASASTQITNISTWGIVSALGHTESTLKSNSTHHFKICTRCYQEINGSKAEHSGGNATCQTKARCDACGALYGKYSEHNMAEVWGFIDPSGHAHMCLTENCYYREEVLPHTPSKNEANEDQVCLDCGYIIAVSESHTHKAEGDFLYDDECHWRLCLCGEIADKSEHNDTDGDGKCDVCGQKTDAESETTGEESVSTDTKADEPAVNDEDNKGSLMWLWILLIIILIICTVLLVLWLIMKKKQNK